MKGIGKGGFDARALVSWSLLTSLAETRIMRPWQDDYENVGLQLPTCANTTMVDDGYERL